MSILTTALNLTCGSKFGLRDWRHRYLQVQTRRDQQSRILVADLTAVRCDSENESVVDPNKIT